jgi:hypothetical protein
MSGYITPPSSPRIKSQYRLNQENRSPNTGTPQPGSNGASSSAHTTPSIGQGSTIRVRGTNIGLKPGDVLTQEQLDEISRALGKPCIGIIDATNSRTVVSAGQRLSGQPETNKYIPVFADDSPSSINASSHAARKAHNSGYPSTPPRSNRARGYAIVAIPGAPKTSESQKRALYITKIVNNLKDLTSTVSIIATRLSEDKHQKLDQEKRINFIFYTYINLLDSKKIKSNGLVQNEIELFLRNETTLISIRNDLELVENIINDVRNIIPTLSSAYQHLNKIYNEIYETHDFEVINEIPNFRDQRIVLNNVNQRIETLYPQEDTRMTIDDRMEALDQIILSVRQRMDHLHTVNRLQPRPRR